MLENYSCAGLEGKRELEVLTDEPCSTVYTSSSPVGRARLILSLNLLSLFSKRNLNIRLVQFGERIHYSSRWRRTRVAKIIRLPLPWFTRARGTRMKPFFRWQAYTVVFAPRIAHVANSM